MTVQELIEALSKANPDGNVYIEIQTPMGYSDPFNIEKVDANKWGALLTTENLGCEIDEEESKE